MKYAFVRAHRHQFSVSRLCTALGVSRSGYYAACERAPSPRAQEDARLTGAIRAVHQGSREAYGAVKTWRVLRERGEACGRHRVARLRRQAGLIARRVRRFRAAYAARNATPPAPNLLQRYFQACRPNQVWVADITFIPTRCGWLYLAVQLDLYARRVVGWSMSTRMDRALVSDALSMAIIARRPAPGLIHHSDQGIQYTSAEYRARLAAHGIVQSMSRKGNCLDNACAESFFSTLKNELVHHSDFRDRDDARAAVFDYIEVFYNRQRRHQTLDYASPVSYEEQTGVP